MTLIRNRLTAFALAVMISITMLFTNMTAAQAVEAPGNIAIHNQGDSDAWLDVQMRRSDGSIYEINLNPGYTAGEGFSLYVFDEAFAWYDRAGWCYKSWYTTNQYGLPTYTSPMSIRSFPATEGHWHTFYPGTLFEGQWVQYVKVWNC